MKEPTGEEYNQCIGVKKSGSPIYQPVGKGVMIIAKNECLQYGTWLRENCIITRNGFRSSKVDGWREEISNEEAYELYLESLRNV
jgi:hypothetical protein